MALIAGRAIVSGEGSGPLLISAEPISFWGGYDPSTGEIIDRRHPLSGRIAAGCVLALPYTIGSSTTTAVLLEAVRQGKAPAAILTTEVDSFLALASIVAQEMYGCPIPIVALDAAGLASLQPGTQVRVNRDGSVETQSPPVLTSN